MTEEQQRTQPPIGGAAMGPIEYYLSFLEFQENGRAAQKGLDGSALQRSQLDVPEEHLTRHNGNYVIVFVTARSPSHHLFFILGKPTHHGLSRGFLLAEDTKPFCN